MMDPSKSVTNPPADWNTSEKSELLPLSPPKYQEQFEPAPGSYPSPSGYPQQQNAAPAGHINPGQPAITVQPTVYVTPTPLANPVPDYLGYSIFTMLCCCVPLGVAALVYSITTRDAISFGHQPIAEKNSRMARILNHTALGIGLTSIVLMIAYCVSVFIIVSSHK